MVGGSNVVTEEEIARAQAFQLSLNLGPWLCTGNLFSLDYMVQGQVLNLESIMYKAIMTLR
jgi:hypothetical protein